MLDKTVRPKKYGPKQCAQLRRKTLNDWVLPKVREVFENNQNYGFAVMLLAQYWGGGAEDAVHCQLLFCNHNFKETIPFPIVQDQPYDIGPELSFPALLRGNTVQAPNYSYGYYRPENWDADGEAVSLFAAFCKSNAHLNMPIELSYAPYATFSVDGRGIHCQQVGRMLRPELDGLRPLAELGKSSISRADLAPVIYLFGRQIR